MGANMSEKRARRKLSGILSADAVGYSRLIQEDEATTIRKLRDSKELMTKLIKQYNGRVVDAPGDNLLAEFGSVVDATDCAVKIQKGLKSRNDNLPENRKLEFRIGINLGDIIEDGGKIYGDGVNIAARIEALAEKGGICISEIVYDQIGNKIDLEFEFIGEHAVKNIKKPQRLYRALIETETIGEINKTFELPDEPSVAVLPFVNMSGDSDQEYFSDGITEDLITDLSKISGLFVIARNSVFTYKGKAVKVQKISEELGVKYVLEGSVRRSDDRIRITAQLIDATTGGHLWAERYDRELNEIFALQDEVTQKIVSVLAVKLTEGEKDRLIHKDTENVQAYDLILRGLEYYFLFKEVENTQARRMFQQAVEIDSEYALAYSRIGRTYLREWSLGWSDDHNLLEQAFELALRAKALDENLPDVYCLLGDIYLWQNKHDMAITALERTITLEPNNAEGLADLAHILTWAGRPEDAIGLVKKATRFNPAFPATYLWVLGHAYYLTSQYREAIATFKRAISRQPDFFPAHAFLAASFVEVGQEEEARAEAAEFMRLSPNLNLNDWRGRLPYKNKAVLDRVIAAWTRVGVK